MASAVVESAPSPSLYHKFSLDSSPPPSPTSLEGQPTDLRRDQGSGPLQPVEVPKILGREVTPPSPPNSMLHEHQFPAELEAANTRGVEAVDLPPRQSIKDKFARVFKGHRRIGSETSGTSKRGFGHRKNNSTSTNTTANPVALTLVPTVTDSSKTSLQEDSPVSANSKHPFYTQPTNPTAIDVTNRGEVRVEILPRPARAYEGDRDESNEYYDYYTRSRPTSPQRSQFYDKDADDKDTDDKDANDKDADNKDTDDSFDGDSELNNISTQELATSGIETPRARHIVEHKGTNRTDSSSESRERRYVEEAARRGFEGYHIGISESSTDVSEEQFSGLPRVDSDQLSNNPIYMNTEKANNNAPSESGLHSASFRSHSSLAQRTMSKNFVNRPGTNRTVSSSSFVITSGQSIVSAGSSNGQTTEEITEELKRLSKISCGSGVSGLAIVVTADGAASTRRSEDSEGEYEGPTWTKEEKGKGKATSPEPSPTQSSRNDSRREQYRHRRTPSDHSEGTEGDTERTSDDSRNDSKTQLVSLPEIVQTKKLRAQEPGKDVLVHQGDPRYEFTYRMRQTPDDNPILVPQYRYPSPLSFTNRNALGPAAPAMAKTYPTVEGSIFPAQSLSHRASGSILKRPPNAVLRSPVAEALEIPQGDHAYDAGAWGSVELHRPCSAMSSSDAHFRTSHQPGRDSYALSMNSLENFGGGFKTVTPKSSADDINRIPSEEHDDRRRVRYSDLPKEPEPPQRSSWLESRGRYLQVPQRPRQFLRRSLTPHLYNPQDIDLDRTHTNAAEDQSLQMLALQEQKRVGRFLLAVCTFFPPLWFVIACGGADSFVASWTNGQVRMVGSMEKMIALVLAGIAGIGALIGVVVGVTSAAS